LITTVMVSSEGERKERWRQKQSRGKTKMAP
jgi:hypothetical protein